MVTVPGLGNGEAHSRKGIDLFFSGRRVGNTSSAILAAAGCLAVILLFYGPLVANAGVLFFSLEGDGLKNYYTFLYHVRYDAAYLHFEGLNYPFGEHIVYTGARPLLAIATQWLGRFLPAVSDGALAVTNLSLLLTLVPTSVILFLILRQFLLPRVYAIGVAVGLALLSPQILRFAGHPGLAYTPVIPACWYFSIRFWKRPSWIWTAALAANTLLWAAMDLYYLFICSAFLTPLALQRLMASRRPRGEFVHLAVQIGLPILVCGLFIVATDPLFWERPEARDTRLFRTSLAALFLPSFPTFGLDWPFLVRWGEPASEGIAYVGLVGVAALPWVSCRTVAFIRRRRYPTALAGSSTGLLTASLLAAVACLLYAFGYPFRLGLEWLIAYLGPLQQFRTVGRLGWVFFYVYTVYVFFLLYVLARSLRKRGYFFAATALPILAVLILWLEAGMQNRTMASFLRVSPERLAALHAESPFLEWTRNIDLSRYQAIIPIPYYHIGSESDLSLHGTERSLFASLVASLKTGLPLTGGFLSRTPLEQTRLSRGLIEGDPGILPYFPDHKPLLVLSTREPLLDSERRLVDASTQLYENPVLVLYEVRLEDLQSMATRTPAGSAHD